MEDTPIRRSGMVVLPGLLDVIESVLDCCSIVEVEPQTFWRQNHDTKYSVNRETLKRIKGWGKPITLHGVGTPVGGSIFDIESQLAPLQESIEILEPLWISEHLSFNRCPRREQFTGFFLPPIQTLETVEIAAKNLHSFRQKLACPVAFETGVNYFPKAEDQLTDGEFIRLVSDYANCGIVLDLHNIWCNERNGRDSVNEVLNAIDFDAVWEVHIAGGDSLDGYFLDSHSLLPDAKLLDILDHSVLPRARNLQSIIFEITTSNYIANGITSRQLISHLDELKLRANSPQFTPADVYVNPSSDENRKRPLQNISTASWEQNLVDLVFGANSPGRNENQISSSIELYKKLIDSNRLGSITSLYLLTVKVCSRVLGPDKTKLFFEKYINAFNPAITSEKEVLQFHKYVKRLEKCPVWLDSCVQIDNGRIEVFMSLEPKTLTLSIDPNLLFEIAKSGEVCPLEPDGKIYHLELSP